MRKREKNGEDTKGKVKKKGRGGRGTRICLNSNFRRYAQRKGEEKVDGRAATEGKRHPS